ncbi:hypothetical protein [Paenibacillus xerothermodurans]|uniref:Uncharacterized protein n=1 Tax=Paenibacillus xerothermodurans TaxID=1977292 RepID=A0A2W1NFC4_PAEXE|nr:hypothetical protein [Paenibacillus xerothermodurans]PZE22674.1 hypothetical protein CBW46_002585 [Paenibacillus xerothermodurans]
MRLEDALFNWLQIKIVAEARTDDRAAEDTRLFFEEILREDHAVSSIETHADRATVYIDYKVDGEQKQLRFDKEAAEQLLEDINSNPKYNNG